MRPLSVGDILVDCDPRTKPIRQVKVVEIYGGKATVENVETGRKTKIDVGSINLDPKKKPSRGFSRMS